MKPQHKNRILFTVLTAFLTLLIPNLSSAESLLMTGTMTAQGTAEHTLSWSLAGGDILGSGANKTTVNFGGPGGTPYSFYADTFGIGANELQFTAGGTNYHWGGLGPAFNSCTNCSFLITVAGQPIMMPVVTTDFSILALSTPVSMSGQLQLCSSLGVCQVNTAVYGQGVINMTFEGRLGGSGAWFLQTGNVTLTSPPPGTNPVPEPATLLLFGSGLAGLAAKRRLRSK